MQEILDAYRNGDMSVRTNLFLSYRELREEFMVIERDEEAALIDDIPASPLFDCRCCRSAFAFVSKIGVLLFGLRG